VQSLIITAQNQAGQNVDTRDIYISKVRCPLKILARRPVWTGPVHFVTVE